MTMTRTKMLAATFCLGFATSHAFAATDAPAALLAEAKVGEAQATAIAMAKVPRGVVKSAELEKERGHLVWSFDIAAPSKRGVTEILVDAGTGKIISIKKESHAEEAKEAQADAAAVK